MAAFPTMYAYIYTYKSTRGIPPLLIFSPNNKIVRKIINDLPLNFQKLLKNIKT